jgi:tRNA threonylcarbamoyladenosine biosynthesis protein TsaE
MGQALAGLEALMQATVELWGPLGAGKTTLVRAILRALGVQGRIKSPTYAVMESYAVPRGDIAHFDFFRFQDPREWEDAGFRDVFSAPGLKISEWPEMASAVLPTPDLRIHIQPVDDDRREVRLEAYTPLGLVLLAGADAAASSVI